MKKTLLLVTLLLGLIGLFAPRTEASSLDPWIYLPMVVNPMPPPADIQFSHIRYNPAGDDVNGEYIELTNYGEGSQNMTGWQVHDAASNTHRFFFPAGFIFAPNATVRIWTQPGTANGNALYWGSLQAVWNNSGDTATLRDGNDVVVHTCSYAGGGEEAGC